MSNSFTARIKSHDSSGIIDSLIKAGKKEQKNVYVGVQKSAEKRESGVSNAQVAAANEFGATINSGQTKVRIPQRSFIRSTVHEKKGEYKEFNKKGAKLILNKKRTIDEHLRLLGQIAENDIKNKMVDLKNPPNSPLTIVRKKSTNPLIDTGQLRSSIRFVVATREEMEK